MRFGIKGAVRKWWLVAAAFSLLAVSCTSAWERHRQRVAELERQGRFREAAEQQRWLVARAFFEAPASERGPQWDAARLVALGCLYGKAGEARLALEAYREALRLDAGRLEDVLAAIDLLPLPEDRRDALMDEFARYGLSLDARAPLAAGRAPECWAYVAYEVRVRRIWTRKGPRGLERVVFYDRRPWVFQPAAGGWRADGDWVENAGAELQPVGGGENPRYQAVLDADRGFYTDGRVPPCHRSEWRGPYDAAREEVYIAASLPKR